MFPALKDNNYQVVFKCFTSFFLMCVFCLHVSVHQCVQYLQRPEEGIGSPRTGAGRHHGLGSECGPFRRVTKTLRHKAIPSAPFLIFKNAFICML